MLLINGKRFFQNVIMDDSEIDNTPIGQTTPAAGAFTTLGLGSVTTKSGAFSGFTAAESKTLNITGVHTNNPIVRQVRLNISNDPTSDENINFRLSFYNSDSMTEDELLKDFFFNLTYTELGMATANLDTSIKLDNIAGLTKYDKVKFLGANGDIERITDLPGTGYSTAVTATAVLDDLTRSGDYTDEIVRNYKVEIDGTGTPDTFKWSNDGGSTWEATAVAITGGAQSLENGLSVTFANTTGHTLGDNWTWTSMPVITVTAVSGINAVDSGLVRVAEINGNFQLYDGDSTNEIHAKLEALSAPTASMDVAIEIDMQ